jgi:hypothetical protein
MSGLYNITTPLSITGSSLTVGSGSSLFSIIQPNNTYSIVQYSGLINDTTSAYSELNGGSSAFPGIYVLGAGSSGGRFDFKIGVNNTVQFLNDSSVNILGTLDSTSPTSGTLRITGGVGIAKNLYVGGNLTVTGNYTVSGTTTFVDSTTLNIADNLIVVNSGPSTTADGGMLVKRFQTTSDVGTGGDVVDTPIETSAIHGGVSGTSTITQIVLNVGANASNDFYNGWWIKVTSGTANDNVRRIKDYVGSTKTALIYTTSDEIATAQTPPTGLDFTSAPTGVSYELYDCSYSAVFFDESVNEWVMGCTSTDPGVSPVIINKYVNLHVNNLITEGDLTFGGSLAISDTTQSTSSTTGALTVAGGVGIAKNLYVGSTLKVETNVNPITGGALNLGGDFVLGATTPRIYFPANSTGQPSFTNRSAGTKIVLWPTTTATSTDYAIGVNTNTLWNSVPTNNELFRWYGGVNEVMSLSGFGNLNVGGITFVNSTAKVGDTVNPTTRDGGALNVGGDLVLGTTRPRIYFPANGGGPPSFPNRSDGTKIVLYPNISAGGVDYAIGINTSTLWNSVPTSSENFRWYGGATQVMSLSGSGNLTVGGTQATAKSDILNVYNPGGGVSGGIILSTVQDIYPTMHHVNFGHDSMAILFDAYYGTDWKSSLSSSNFGIFKNSGKLTFNYTSGFAPGSNSDLHTKPAIAINASGQVSFPVTTESTSLGTGAIVVSGGVGIAKRLNVGGNLSAVDVIILDSTNTGRLRLVSTGGANYIQSGLDSIADSYAPLYFTSINGVRTFMSILDTSVRIAHTTRVDTIVNPSSTNGINGALNVRGDIILGNTNPRIYFPNSTSTTAPTFTNRSGGAKIVLWPSVSPSSGDWAIGMGNDAMWHSSPTNSAASAFRWYGGVTEIMALTASGKLKLNATTTDALNVGPGNTFVVNTLEGLVAVNGKFLIDGTNTDQIVVRKGGGGQSILAVNTSTNFVDIRAQTNIQYNNPEAFLVKTAAGANVLSVDTSGSNGKVNANVIQSRNGFVLTGTSPIVITSLPYNYNGFLSLNWDNGTSLYYYSRVGAVSNGVIRLIFDNVASVIVTAEFTDTGSSINLTVRTDGPTRTVYWSIVNVAAV